MVGAQPAHRDGRTISVASDTLCRGKFTEGASWEICAVSVVPVFLISAAPKSRTGTASSSAAGVSCREPTTTSTEASDQQARWPDDRAELCAVWPAMTVTASPARRSRYVGRACSCRGHAAQHVLAAIVRVGAVRWAEDDGSLRDGNAAAVRDTSLDRSRLRGDGERKAQETRAARRPKYVA